MNFHGGLFYSETDASDFVLPDTGIKPAGYPAA